MRKSNVFKDLPIGLIGWLTAGLTVLVFGIVTISFSPADATPLTCTWTGTTNTNFSTATNWSGCNSAAPTNGDNLVFNDTLVTSLSKGELTNNISNLQVGSISFNGSSAYGYLISGNAISLGGGIADTSTGTTNFLDLAITLTANQAFSTNGQDDIGDSSIDLTTGTYTLTLEGDGGTIDLSSPIVGTGIINLDGTGDTWAFLYSNDPNFSGQIEVTTGRMIINESDPTALGTASVTISSGATLQDSINTSGTFSVSNPITMIGGGDAATGAVDVHDFSGGTSTVNFTGAVTLGGNTQIGLFSASADFSDIISGCLYTLTEASGSGGVLTHGYGGSCAPAVTTSNTSSSDSTVKDPETGFGESTQTNALLTLGIYELVSISLFGLAIGLHKVYR